MASASSIETDLSNSVILFYGSSDQDMLNRIIDSAKLTKKDKIVVVYPLDSFYSMSDENKARSEEFLARLKSLDSKNDVILLPSKVEAEALELKWLKDTDIRKWFASKVVNNLKATSVIDRKNRIIVHVDELLETTDVAKEEKKKPRIAPLKHNICAGYETIEAETKDGRKIFALALWYGARKIDFVRIKNGVCRLDCILNRLNVLEQREGITFLKENAPKFPQQTNEKLDRNISRN